MAIDLTPSNLKDVCDFISEAFNTSKELYEKCLNLESELLFIKDALEECLIVAGVMPSTQGGAIRIKGINWMTTLLDKLQSIYGAINPDAIKAAKTIRRVEQIKNLMEKK
jgi:hypothetical protein